MNPFVIVAAALGIISVVGGLIINWKKIRKFWFGKNIAILGSIETGKTTLHSFLREGIIVKQHYATTKKTKVPKNSLKLAELKLKISEGSDISGMNEFLIDWKEVFLKCDICFYMFDVRKIYSGDSKYINEVTLHLSSIQLWNSSSKNTPKIILIGTFSDKINEYTLSNKSNIQVFNQKIIRKLKPAYLKLKISPSSIFIGSLKDKISIEKLVGQILVSLK